MTASSPSSGRSGRPHSEAVTSSILQSVLDLVAEAGSIGAISMDAVAQRSGASKATIYRRWSSKQELVWAAVESIQAPAVYDLPHDSLRDDLIRIGTAVRVDLSARERRLLRCVMLESNTDPELRKQQDQLIARRRRAGVAAVQYWIDRGELRADLDPELAYVMLISPLLTSLVYGNYPSLRSARLVERVVDELLSGTEARG